MPEPSFLLFLLIYSCFSNEIQSDRTRQLLPGAALLARAIR